MTVLHELVRDAEDAESVFDETHDPELGDAAYMDVIASRSRIRAEIRRVRKAAGIETVSIEEANQIQAGIMGLHKTRNGAGAAGTPLERVPNAFHHAQERPQNAH